MGIPLPRARSSGPGCDEDSKPRARQASEARGGAMGSPKNPKMALVSCQPWKPPIIRGISTEDVKICDKCVNPRLINHGLTNQPGGLLTNQPAGWHPIFACLVHCRRLGRPELEAHVCCSGIDCDGYSAAYSSCSSTDSCMILLIASVFSFI